MKLIVESKVTPRSNPLQANIPASKNIIRALQERSEKPQQRMQPVQRQNVSRYDIPRHNLLFPDFIQPIPGPLPSAPATAPATAPLPLPLPSNTTPPTAPPTAPVPKTSKIAASTTPGHTAVTAKNVEAARARANAIAANANATANAKANAAAKAYAAAKANADSRRFN
jgi:hypothetical protein